jgi:hypothetical protein
MRFPHLPLLSACLLTSACAPPEAPKRLEELAAFIFAHADDEDEEVLAVAAVNLDTWLANGNQQETEEGFQIDQLHQQHIDGLPGRDYQLNQEDLVGAAVLNEHHHDTRRVMQSLTTDDWESIMGDQYEYYRKTFSEGKTCIVARECLWAEASSESELVQLGVSIVSDNTIQYRWVDTEIGWVGFHRSWLDKAPEVSSDLVDPKAQYLISVMLPDGGHTLRLQATWIDTKIAGFSIPKSVVAKTMRDQGDMLEEWMNK